MIPITENIKIAHPNSINVIFYDLTLNEITTVTELKEYVKIMDDGSVIIYLNSKSLNSRKARIKRFFQLLSQFRIPRFS
jgi:hypothetical protein